MIDVMTAVVGGALTVVTWLSVFRTVFTHGQAPSRAALSTTRLAAALVMPFGRLLGPAKRERLLALCAPLALFAMFGVWFTGSTTGFLLLATASGAIEPGPSDLGRLLAFHLDGTAIPLAVAATLSGVLLVAVFGVHLSRVVGAYSRRELLVARLSVHATKPSDAEHVIATYVRTDSRDQLDAWFGAWAEWLADIGCTHVSSPSLVYFRTAGSLSWLEAAVIVLDAAALLEATAPDWAPPNTHVLLGAGADCLPRLASRVGIALSRPKVSLHGREQCGFADTIQTTLFAGLPMARTQPVAWEVFQQERTKYAPYASAISARLQYGRDAARDYQVSVVTTENKWGRA